ncbi:MAG: membrane protein insertase YidC [Hyphomonadaceae bacterium]
MQTRGPGQGPGDTRNLIIFLALSVAVFLGYDYFVSAPARREAALHQQAVVQQQQEAAARRPAEPVQTSTREDALAETASARIHIETPALTGSLLLRGARLDDLDLKEFRETVDPRSPPVTLLSPANGPGSEDAYFGWEAQQSGAQNAAQAVADSFSGWSAPSGAQLTPQTPLVLTLAAPNGLAVTRTISVDDNSMFTITDRVRNEGDAAQQVRPFATVRRHGLPDHYKFSQIVHQGLTGVFGPDQILHEERFENADKHVRNKSRGKIGEDAHLIDETGQGGWLGVTDHYWLAALVPDQNERISAYYDSRAEGDANDYRAAYRGAWRPLPPGQEVTYTQHFFAGAKRVDVLRAYQQDLAIPDFDKAVDWGFFFFLTRPYFDWLLHPLSKLAGSFGWGILLTTIVVKVLLFPAVFQANLAMTKMRKLQPKIKDLQERFSADKQRQQQEMMRLYQTEKINPVAGCLPILLQIPVFYALYKTLTVTIEMRHAPFPGLWIHDLSAPDPANIMALLNLAHVPAQALMSIPLLGPFILTPLFHMSVFAVAYGVTMWALQALNPPPTDATQAMIFRWMPVLFTFMFASFPVGLVIYWTWSNVLSIAQQYIIMRTQGVETELDKFIAKRFGKHATENAG